MQTHPSLELWHDGLLLPIWATNLHDVHLKALLVVLVYFAIPKASLRTELAHILEDLEIE